MPRETRSLDGADFVFPTLHVPKKARHANEISRRGTRRDG